MSEPPTTSWPPAPGEVLSGRYEVRALLGRGGMGAVLRAEDMALGRPVAVKVLDPSLADEPEFRERFASEARALAALDHPSIVPVLDVGTSGDRHYFVMKLLSGQVLSARLREGPPPLHHALSIAIDVLDGLEHMHSRGVIHRDIKPGNIHVSSVDGHAVILDFGVLRLQDSDRRLTKSGEYVGTPEYVAPELILTQPGDARTDVYSLGITLYEMLTGRVPFRGETRLEVVTQQLRDPPRPPSQLVADLPAALDAAALRALEKEPEKRFVNAAEMRDVLQEIYWSTGGAAEDAEGQ